MDSSTHQSQSNRSPFKLHNALKHRTVAEREAAVQRGVVRLRVLRSILFRNQSLGHYGISQWQDQISNAMKQADQKKAVIGVVGNTGAGKTSLINAVLGEGQLLPTNCMRACTATITEIAYNNSPIPYVAEIEYYDVSEWQRELELGWRILFDSSGKITREATNQDTDAGVFYAKLKAVYSDLTRENLQESSVDLLLNHPNLSVLGTVQKVEDYSATSFASRLQLIIDSKEHNDDDDTRRSTQKRRANWPLIRRARIAIKSQVLETGVTLVDLPGVQDSNAARAKIATDYLMECSGLLVAAPIHRAVDDKIAKNLLGKSFKRQIMMDGGFNTVTFVCTKADDISVTESARSPAIASVISKLTQESQTVRGAIKRLREEIKKSEGLKAEVEKQIKVTYDRQRRIESGEYEGEVQSSDETFNSSVSSKRKGNERSAETNPIKKRALQNDLKSNGTSLPAQQAIASPNDLSACLAEMNKLQKDNEDLSGNLNLLRNDLNGNESRVATIESQKVALCVKERNTYVEKALKRDFVSGVREFDQEQMGRGDKEYDVAIDHRDYEKLHDALPVYCVSAKAFQKSLGHLEHEPNIVGFEDEEASGIPALQDYCKRLTDSGRSKSADFFLAMFSALMNSLSLFVVNEVDGVVLTEEQRAALKINLEEKLIGLKSRLQRIVKDACAEAREKLKNHLYTVFEPAYLNASREATAIANGWNQLAHQTWRAVCVRQGSFNNLNGKYDWNEDLVGPILDLVAPKWESIFNDVLQKTFQKFSLSCRKAVKDFHRSIPLLFEALGSQAPASHMQLEAQLEAYKNAFEVVENYGKDFITSQQRQISRAFKPVIRDAMSSAYRRCLAETGGGSWARMKEHMAIHITNNPGMFRDSTRVVQTQLDNLIKSLREKLLEHILSVYDDIYLDYVTTLLGSEANDDGNGPSPLTDELIGFTMETKRMFERLVAELESGVPLEDLAEAPGDTTMGGGASNDGFPEDTAADDNCEMPDHMEMQAGMADSDGHDVPYEDGAQSPLFVSDD